MRNSNWFILAIATLCLAIGTAVRANVSDQDIPTTDSVIQHAKPQNLVFPDEPFRGHQPQAGPARPFHIPDIRRFTLDNGVDVYLLEKHTLPMVSIELNFDGGMLTDPRGKGGLSSVCMAMLTEGTERLDKIAYNSALADIASSIGAHSSRDTHSLTLWSLSKHLDATFDLYADTLRSPGLRASDFERKIKRSIEALKQVKGNPVSVAGRVRGAVLYGPQHPFGTLVTESSLNALKLDDCRRFVTTWLQPENARLFVVGDITEPQLRRYFEGEKLASWKGAPPKIPELVKPKPMAGRIFFVDIPEAQQSEISLLQFGPERTSPEYFDNTIMSAVFGGGFSSRINMNLREEKGYSYGATGQFSYSRNYGVFFALASVRTDATYQSLLEIHHEVTELKTGAKPPTEQEVEREKQGAILAFPDRFSTGQSTLNQFEGLVYFGLPLDYFNGYVAQLKKVTVAQVAEAAARELKPDQDLYIVVGDGSAPVVVRDPVSGADVPYTKDGKPVTLHDALAGLAKSGVLGPGGFVEIDEDGVRLP